MRFRTAAILSAVLVGGMLVIFPAIVEAIFLPSLRQGIPNPVPDYEANLLGFALLCHRFRWFLAPLTVMLFFLIAAFTSESAVRR